MVAILVIEDFEACLWECATRISIYADRGFVGDALDVKAVMGIGGRCVLGE